MRDLQTFLGSLSEDLSPEDKAEALQTFAAEQEAEARLMESNNQKGVNKLKEQQSQIISEAKKVAADPEYIFELNKTNPELAEKLVSEFGNGVTIEDLKKGTQGAAPGSSNKTFEEQMAEYNQKEAVKGYKESFAKAVGFTAEEKQAFDTQLETLGANNPNLTVDQVKTMAIGVAFSMGKKLSNDPNDIIAKHNVIPDGRSGGGEAPTSGKEYKPHDPTTMDLLEQMGAITPHPKK